MKSVFALNTTFQTQDGLNFPNQTLYSTQEGADQAKQDIIDSLKLIPCLGSNTMFEPQFPNTMTTGFYSFSIEEKEILE